VNFNRSPGRSRAGRDGGAGQRFPEAVVVEVERAKRLVLPIHHDVREKDVDLRRLLAALTVAAERGPAEFPELLLTPGIGGRTLFRLVLVGRGGVWGC